MRVLCVGRHAVLSGHFCRYLSECGVESHPAVGLAEAMAQARVQRPDVVMCDYDLLTSASLERWAQEPGVRGLPLIAVSLTRRPEEVYVGEGTPIAGFLYLPTLDRADASRVLGAAARASGISAPSSLPLPGARAIQHR